MVNALWGTPNRQLCFSHCGKVLINVFGRDAWTDEEWRTFATESVKVAESVGWFHGSLTFASGRAPSATQRNMSGKMAPKETLKLLKGNAVVTNSGLLRGMITMTRWLNFGTIQAFEPTRYLEAINWLRTRAEFDVNEAAD